jgi:hypothetical protein
MPTLLMLAASAAAASVFAPPLGNPIRYETIQRRPTPQGESIIEVRHDVVFTREDGGYRLTITEPSFKAPPGDAMAIATLDAGKVPVRIHLNAIGEPVRVIDLPATWNAYIAALHAHPASVSYANQLAAQPPATREAQFLQDAEMFVPSNITGENAFVTREPGTGNTVRLYRVSQRALPNGGRMTTAEHIVVQHPSGLIIGFSRTTQIIINTAARVIEANASATRMIR